MGSRLSFVRLSAAWLTLLLLTGCRSVDGVVGQHESVEPCTPAWYEAVEQAVRIADEDGHGPDLAGDEWQAAVEFKLGVQDAPGLPARGSPEWCEMVDELVFREKAADINVSGATVGVQGIWKMCYEPELEDVHEIDEGYLVLMPDGRYYQLNLSCCDEELTGPSWDLDRYAVDGDQVVLEITGYQGKREQRRLRHMANVSAVFFDNPDAPPVVTDALLAGDDLVGGR